MKYGREIRNIIVATYVTIFLSWTFFKNQLMGKMFIIPFLICAIASLDENISFLVNKPKITTIFKYIFRISFFIYYWGFLIYATYYTISSKTYSLLLIIAIFIVGGFVFWQKKL